MALKPNTYHPVTGHLEVSDLFRAIVREQARTAAASEPTLVGSGYKDCLLYAPVDGPTSGLVYALYDDQTQTLLIQGDPDRIHPGYVRVTRECTVADAARTVINFTQDYFKPGAVALRESFHRDDEAERVAARFRG
jgi:hypothetical protein